MIKTVRTTSADKDFITLVDQLNSELALRDGDMHEFYHQFNAIDNLNHVVLVYKNKVAVGCGAFKPFNDESVEIKRMFVPKNYRGQRIATIVLDALETWAKELGFKICVLETGKKQPEAIALYSRRGYTVTKNYGQYIGVENSVCFKKQLSATPTNS